MHNLDKDCHVCESGARSVSLRTPARKQCPRSYVLCRGLRRWGRAIVLQCNRPTDCVLASGRLWAGPDLGIGETKYVQTRDNHARLTCQPEARPDSPHQPRQRRQGGPGRLDAAQRLGHLLGLDQLLDRETFARAWRRPGLGVSNPGSRGRLLPPLLAIGLDQACVVRRDVDPLDLECGHNFCGTGFRVLGQVRLDGLGLADRRRGGLSRRGFGASGFLASDFLPADLLVFLGLVFFSAALGRAIGIS